VLALVVGQEINGQLNARDTLERRDYDSYKILNRKRNAHACIMSIVFIVLFPLGAISVHLPIDRISFLRNTYLRNKIPAIHAPIQMIGFVMMVGAMALGIRIAHDLGYFSGKTQAHIVIGLLVTSTLILIQPLMGILQHRHFKKTGGKSVFAYIHRWVGRGAIILGIINNGLGFQLAQNDIIVPTRSYVRNFVLAGVLLFVYVALIAYDQFRKPMTTTKTEPVKGSDGILDAKSGA
jgi:uncharacterized membrane protein (DUF485 family)